MTLENLTIIGTSHISIESVNKVKETVSTLNPDIIAVELDKNRLTTLLTKKKNQKISLSLIPKIGLKGFLFMIMASWFQKKMGKLVKLEPGSDMLAAVKMAQKNNIRLALIDQDIQITLAKLSKRICWKEKWNFFTDLIRGLFRPRNELKKMGLENIDLRKVPSNELIKKMMHHFKKRYPNVFHVLVTERNSIMAKRLYHIITKNPAAKIVAVVGAGHENEMYNLINSLFEANGGVTYSHSYSMKS